MSEQTFRHSLILAEITAIKTQCLAFHRLSRLALGMKFDPDQARMRRLAARWAMGQLWTNLCGHSHSHMYSHGHNPMA
jgi:hypothetical protein